MTCEAPNSVKRPKKYENNLCSMLKLKNILIFVLGAHSLTTLDSRKQNM